MKIKKVIKALKRLEKKRTDLTPWYMLYDERLITKKIIDIKKLCPVCNKRGGE